MADENRSKTKKGRQYRDRRNAVRARARRALPPEPRPLLPPKTTKNSRRRRAVIRALLRRDGDRCVYCGAFFGPLNPPTVDHVVARSEGGTGRQENLVLACGPCNENKGGVHATGPHGPRYMRGLPSVPGGIRRGAFVVRTDVSRSSTEEGEG